MSSPGKDRRIVIAGGGNVGLRTAEILDERGHTVMIVEKDPDRCTELSDAYVATVIEGDATHPDILAQTGIEEADVVAALTNDVSANLATCMMALQLNGDVHTVLRTDAETGEVHKDLVGNVIFPERASALLSVNAILGGDVRSLEHAMGTLQLMEVRVTEDAPAAGKALVDVSFPKGSLVVSDTDGSQVARPDTVLEPGSLYIIACEENVVREVIQLLRG